MSVWLADPVCAADMAGVKDHTAQNPTISAVKETGASIRMTTPLPNSKLISMEMKN
jgi:hypothetical protein